MKAFTKTRMRTVQSNVVQAEGRSLGPALGQPPPPSLGPSSGPGACRQSGEGALWHEVHSLARQGPHSLRGSLVPMIARQPELDIRSLPSLLTPAAPGPPRDLVCCEYTGSFKTFCLVHIVLCFKCFLQNLVSFLLHVESPSLLFQPQLTG